MTSERTWDITSSLNSAFNSVVDDLNRCGQFAQLADQLAKLPEDLELPRPDGALHMAPPGFDPENPLDPITWGKARDDFSKDCQRYAVVGMISACETYFRQLFLIGDLVQALDQNRHIKLTQVRSLRQTLFERTRRIGPLRVLGEALKKLGGNPNNLKGIDWFDTLYKLRICLVHRGGIVRDIDANEEGNLCITLRRIVMMVDDDVILDQPFLWKREGTLKLKPEDEEWSWATGEAIQLAPAQISSVFYTLSGFCTQVYQEACQGVELLLKSTE